MKYLELAELAELINGSTPLKSNKKFWDNGTINWFTAGDLRNGSEVTNTKKFITKFALDNTSIKLVPKDSILLCCTASIGLIGINKIELTTNQQFNAIVPNRELINTRYLLYFLKSYMSEFKKKASTTTVGFISQKKVKSILVPVPSLQEQEEIVERLDKVFENNFEYINNISSELVELEKLEKSFIKKMFDDEKCESFKLSNFFDITSSKRVFKNEWKDEGVPFLRARELVKLANNLEFKDPIYISNSHYEQIKNKYGVPKAGDILITGVGTLGITYLVNSSKKFYFKDGNIIWLKNLNKVNPDYIKSYIDSPDFQDKINKKIGATVKTFTISDAKNFEVPIPSEEKQKIIFEKIQEFKNIKNDLKNSYEHKIKKINLLKKSILNNEFSYE
jgi:type I restriction enzyme S subunit